MSKSQPGLSRLDDKGPNGLTLIPWKLGKCAVCDVTIADTSAISYISVTSQPHSRAAKLTANRKRDKYVDLANNHLSAPIAIDSLYFLFQR